MDQVMEFFKAFGADIGVLSMIILCGQLLKALVVGDNEKLQWCVPLMILVSAICCVLLFQFGTVPSMLRLTFGYWLAAMGGYRGYKVMVEGE